MKIVHVIYSLGYGGIETMLVNIVNEQVQFEHNISIICINNTVNEGLRNSIDKRVRFIEIGRPRHSRNPYYVLKFNRILLKLNADIYHFHSPTMYRFILPFFKNFFKERQCVVVHDVLNDFEQKYLSKYKNVFAISKSVKDNILTSKSRL